MTNKLARTLASASLVSVVPLVAIALLWRDGTLAFDRSTGFLDPGAFTRWGLPTVRAVRDAAATLTIGALVMIAVVLPPEDANKPRQISGVRASAKNIAVMSGITWVWSGMGTLILTFSEFAGFPPGSPEVQGELYSFATDFELGRLLMASIVLSTCAVLASVYSRSLATLAALGLLALAALWPLALSGHAAASSNHDLAVNAQFLHLVGVTVWVGGLATLALLRTRLGDALPVVVARYSRLAGWSFAFVALSGTMAALLRIPSWSDLTTDYGSLLTLKVFALLVLGVIGWQQRRRIIPALETSSGSATAFKRLLLLELMVMAMAMGVAVALSRTPPPAVRERPLTAAESLLGYPLPPPLSIETWFSQWQIDTLWAPLSIVAAACYLLGVRRLRSRGDTWSTGRAVSWVIGCLMLLWATSGSPGAYGDVLFSMHMVQHMTLATGVPVFLVLGAPVTLSMRALRRRQDGSRGAREWLLLTVHSPIGRLLAHPLVATALFIVGLVVFYYSPLFEQSMRSHTVHLWMVTHFLITGYLFANVLVGVDPGPQRPPYPFRVLLLMVTFGFHAFFSVSLMSSNQLLAAEWYEGLGRTWGASLADDQYAGASLGWLLGDYPLAILAAALIWSWVNADKREAKRHDRKEAREGDQELEAYNDRLRQFSQRDRESS